MGRAGRYTLSVMAWIAAAAGWSSVLGLLAAAITGDEAREVSPATSALFYVLVPLVPTIVALWFNDWARDGFPTREQRRAQAQRAKAPVQAEAPVQGMPIQDTRIQDAVPVEAVPVEAVPAEVAAPALAVTAPARQAERRAATPLGVPEGPPAEVGAGFPVAPLLRDRLDLDGR